MSLQLSSSLQCLVRPTGSRRFPPTRIDSLGRVRARKTKCGCTTGRFGQLRHAIIVELEPTPAFVDIGHAVAAAHPLQSRRARGPAVLHERRHLVGDGATAEHAYGDDGVPPLRPHINREVVSVLLVHVLHAECHCFRCLSKGLLDCEGRL